VPAVYAPGGRGVLFDKRTMLRRQDGPDLRARPRQRHEHHLLRWDRRLVHGELTMLPALYVRFRVLQHVVIATRALPVIRDLG
jgi:hypothetical protein